MAAMDPDVRKELDDFLTCAVFFALSSKQKKILKNFGFLDKLKLKKICDVPNDYVISVVRSKLLHFCGKEGSSTMAMACMVDDERLEVSCTLLFRVHKMIEVEFPETFVQLFFRVKNIVLKVSNSPMYPTVLGTLLLLSKSALITENILLGKSVTMPTLLIEVPETKEVTDGQMLMEEIGMYPPDGKDNCLEDPLELSDSLNTGNAKLGTPEPSVRSVSSDCEQPCESFETKLENKPKDTLYLSEPDDVCSLNLDRPVANDDPKLDQNVFGYLLKKNDSSRIPVFGSFLIGRHSKSSLHLSDATVSRKHILIENLEESSTLKIVSANKGILINGVKYTTKEEILLKDRDLIRIGRQVFVWEEVKKAPLRSIKQEAFETVDVNYRRIFRKALKPPKKSPTILVKRDGGISSLKKRLGICPSVISSKSMANKKMAVQTDIIDSYRKPSEENSSEICSDFSD